MREMMPAAGPQPFQINERSDQTGTHSFLARSQSSSEPVTALPSNSGAESVKYRCTRCSLVFGVEDLSEVICTRCDWRIFEKLKDRRVLVYDTI